MNLPKAIFFSKLCAIAASSNSIRGASYQRDLGTRIIGGDEASEGRYSYAVSLQDEVGHFCGGSLVAPDIVLSASHCMQYGVGYKAVIGRHNLTTADGDEVTVKTEITHPGFDWGTTENDYMILVLDRPTVEDVDLVQVSPDTVSVGSAVTVMGWGDTHPSDSIQTRAEELMETEVFVVSNEECDQSNGTVGGTEHMGSIIGGYEDDYHNQITDDMMCAKDGGEDSCQGDSGGPLVIRSNSGADMQVGIVSWGVSCAHEDFPGVYARISAQYDWIRTHVCEQSSDPPASFDCGNRIAETSTAQGTQALRNTGSWSTIIEEDFSGGFGMFNQHGNNANYYSRALNRFGVVRISDGVDGSSAMTSNSISLASSPYTMLKIKFSFYAIEMEHSDDLCLNYELDDGAVTGEKCWSSLHAFDNDRWYDDKSLVFAASNANSLKIRFRVKGDDDVDDDGDDVLISSVTIQGQA